MFTLLEDPKSQPHFKILTLQEGFSRNLVPLLAQLLNPDEAKRLGSAKHGGKAIKEDR